MTIDSVDYWRKYHQLRLNAKEWNIDYKRYTHAQLQYAMEMNGGKINSTLRMYLNILPPTNAFYMAKSPALAESHKGVASMEDAAPQPVARKPEPKPEPAPQPQEPRTNFSFSLPAPKEASVWSRMPAL